MNRRYLRIKNFKNIGVTSDNKFQKINLNNSLNPKTMGELIIVIGENNSGKSNVLEAIRRIKTKDLSKDTNKFLNYNKNKPEIILTYKENESTKKTIMYNEYKLYLDENKKTIESIEYDIPDKNSKNNNNIDTSVNNNTIDSADVNNNTIDDTDVNKNIIDDTSVNNNTIDDNVMQNKLIEKITEKFNAIEYTVVRDYPYNSQNQNIIKLKKDYENIIKLDKPINEKYYEIEKIYELIRNIVFTNYPSFILSDGLPVFNYLLNETDSNNVENNSKKEEPNIKKDIIKEKYGIPTEPKIIFYEEKIIKEEELKTNMEQIGSSVFFNALLKSISKDVEYLKEAYEEGKESLSFRDTYEEEINKLLANNVSKKFNELYYNINNTNNKDNQKYEFKIKLESDNIHVYLKKNGDGINLDYQSTGFKWFFNLYFNFLYADILNAGDIVLMDEPDAHLSLPARRDLRKFLKEFARKTGVTFVVATHNPSFIDIDHLDEIRIVKHKKNGVGVEIINEFYAVNGDNQIDTLEDIINCFGVLHRDIITNPNNKVVFVEGITDYNYLTAFKLIREKRENKKLNLVFLPINGLGGTDEDKKNVIKKLSSFRNAVLLADGDGAGIKFESLNTDKILKIIKLNDIPNMSNNIKVIEDVFSENDRSKYSYVVNKNKKSSRGSSLFKNTISYEKLDKESIDNFNKILDYFSVNSNKNTVNTNNNKDNNIDSNNNKPNLENNNKNNDENKKQ